MTRKIHFVFFILFAVLASCSKNKKATVTPATSSADPTTTRGNTVGQSQPGVITAGEWNDLDNWAYWQSLVNRTNYTAMPGHWSIYNNNRFSVKVMGTDGKPAANVIVDLKKDGISLFRTRTDNLGRAELWADLFQQNSTPDISKLSIDVDNASATITNVKSFSSGINEITIAPTTTLNKIEIAMVVDATGSMGDELEYLKTELMDVLTRVTNANPGATLNTGSVFYKDQTDDYVTRVSDFTTDISATVNFIKKQSAGGGGDFPEAVHSALDKALNELQWSSDARTRILFLVLDAPPHHSAVVTSALQSAITKAAQMGVKIIPVTASGIDKETEFLMRFMSISTNGTYVFITDDSGVGNEHLEPTVGQYNVELLNNLMVRLINKYAQ